MASSSQNGIVNASQLETTPCAHREPNMAQLASIFEKGANQFIPHIRQVYAGRSKDKQLQLSTSIDEGIARLKRTSDEIISAAAQGIDKTDIDIESFPAIAQEAYTAKREEERRERNIRLVQEKLGERGEVLIELLRFTGKGGEISHAMARNLRDLAEEMTKRRLKWADIAVGITLELQERLVKRTKQLWVEKLSLQARGYVPRDFKAAWQGCSLPDKVFTATTISSSSMEMWGLLVLKDYLAVPREFAENEMQGNRLWKSDQERHTRHQDQAPSQIPDTSPAEMGQLAARLRKRRRIQNSERRISSQDREDDEEEQGDEETDDAPEDLRGRNTNNRHSSEEDGDADTEQVHQNKRTRRNRTLAPGTIIADSQAEHSSVPEDSGQQRPIGQPKVQRSNGPTMVNDTQAPPKSTGQPTFCWPALKLEQHVEKDGLCVRFAKTGKEGVEIAPGWESTEHEMYQKTWKRIGLEYGGSALQICTDASALLNHTDDWQFGAIFVNIMAHRERTATHAYGARRVTVTMEIVLDDSDGEDADD